MPAGPSSATPALAAAALPSVAPSSAAASAATAPGHAHPPRPRAELAHTRRLLAAGSGSVLTTLMMTPFDVIKTRVQLHVASTARAPAAGMPLSAASASASPAAVAVPTTTAQAALAIVRREGALALWKGLTPGLIAALPSTMTYYAGYDVIRNDISPLLTAAGLGFYIPLVSGMSARACATFIVSPLELVRTRMQSRQGPEGLRHAFREIGISPKAVYRGLGPSLWRDVPFSGIYWLIYEQIHTWQHESRWSGRSLGARLSSTWPSPPSPSPSPSSPARRPGHDRSPPAAAPGTPLLEPSAFAHWLAAFQAGAVAGGVAGVLTQPFDVVKTHQQTMPGHRITTWPYLLDLKRRHGAAVLWRGTVPRMLKVIPACAIMISSYELGKRWLH
ncbi:hypothetical protein CXG81DRAFT_16647 [Caulochytrium protostelioides]|uniref:Mitochondrial carrier n=1 Tax=Caulochytrium protostelioides TaxID=1555241 RepID=A0A4P9XE85_9FUNG|nr:hypothetical protein CXG81DRAFT_16647 [Caulochytrium protostelioides]|eukprot:RKP03812.1 hypothetical protein CXG81DRAFT_16647 [Caulochytrium protostelioides]